MRRFGQIGSAARRVLAYLAVGATVVTAAVAIPPSGTVGAAPIPVLFDAIVQPNSPAFAAWSSLEAEARETVATMRGVPNDSKLAWFARDEIRAVMIARLGAVLQDVAAGTPVTAQEQGWVDAMLGLLKAKRIAEAQAAIAEYDRFIADSCAYQPPPDAGFSTFTPCPIPAFPGQVVFRQPPSAEQFGAYGAAVVAQQTVLDADAVAETQRALQAVAVLGAVAASGVALGFGAASGLFASVVATAFTPLVAANGFGITLFTPTAFVAAGGAALGVVAVIVLAAAVTAVGIWQQVEAADVPVRLQRRLDLVSAPGYTPDIGALLTANGSPEVFALMLAQTLPDLDAERAAASTPVARTASDPLFRIVTEGRAGQTVPSIRSTNWAGQGQTTYISGRWFVTQVDGGTPEWDATLEYRDGTGRDRTAYIGPDGFVVTSRTIGGNFITENTNRLWAGDTEYVLEPNLPGTAAITLIRPIVEAGEDANVLVEGEPIAFRASVTSGGAAVTAPTVEWYLQPVGVTALGCTWVGGTDEGCPWDQVTGTEVFRTYAQSGEYGGEVRVTTANGLVTRQGFRFTVANRPPTLEVDQAAASTITVSEGTAVTFSGTSSDPGDDQLRISVDWGDGTVQSQSYPCAGPVATDGTCTAAILGSASDPTSWTRTRTYPRPGTYTVTITADDFQGGSTSTTRQVVVPAATVSVDQPFVTTNGSSVDLVANIRSFGDIPYRVTVDWGDGTTTTADGPCTGPSCAFGGAGPGGGIITLCPGLGQRCTWFDASHTYAVSGDYTITVTPSRPAVDLTFDARTTIVQVVNTAPTAFFNPSQPCPTGGLVICLPTPDPDTRDVLVGSAARLRGQVADNTIGTVTGTIDWGDGTAVETVSLVGAATWNGACTLTSPCSPNARFFDVSHVYATAGEYTVTFVADDRDEGIRTITTRVVVRPNGSPIVVGDTIRTIEDVGQVAFVEGGLLSNDSDPEDDPLQVTSFTQPANGTVTVHPDGSYSFTPTRDANGTSTFTYTVSDGRTSSTGTVTVEITAVNDTPAPTGPVGYALFEDGTVCLFGCPTVLARFADVEGDPLVAELITPPANGTLSPALAADGTFGYVPAADRNGTDSFVFRVCERDRPTVCTQPVTASIEITPVNDAPSFVAGASQTVPAPGAAVTVPGWATAISPGPADEATQQVSFTAVADDPSLFAPDGAPAVSADGTLTFRAVAAGSTQVSIVAVDDGSAAAPGTSRSEPQVFTITVASSADLRMTNQVGLSAVSTPVVEGGSVTGQVGVANDGPQATVAQIQVSLDGLALRPGAPLPAGYSPTTGIWTVEVPVGASRAIELPLVAGRAGTLAITGEVVGSAVADPDSTPGNGTVGAAAAEDDHGRAVVSALSRFALRSSTSNQRTAPVLLDGATVSGSIAVFVPTATDIARVDFFVDDPTMSRAPRQVERTAPYDFAGTAGTGRAVMFSTRTLTDGLHTITARVVLRNGSTQVVTSSFTVSNPRPATRQLMVSTQSTRAGALPLDGRSVSGPVAVYVPNETGIVSVEFRLDGRLVRVERSNPWDFGSTLGNGRAALVRFAPGTRTVTARIVFSDGSTDTLRAAFAAT